MWVKSKNTTSCMQQNASKEYKSGKTTVQITRFLSENTPPFCENT
jgi:hypothetical protein